MSERTTVSRIDTVFCASGRSQASVGLDVHKRTIHAAVWTGERIAASWVMPADSDKVAAMLAPHADKIKRVVYEAGPTGFGLARVLRKAGLAVEVVAPGRTPRPAARENKSDRLDCKRLAEYAAKGLLEPVAVPSETEEAVRRFSVALAVPAEQPTGSCCGCASSWWPSASASSSRSAASCCSTPSPSRLG